MLRHTGRRRNFEHNFRLAAILCFTAGFINAAGFIAFAVLTTNVTGHAAFVAVKLAEGDFRSVRMIGLWLLLFLAGAFYSSYYMARKGGKKSYTFRGPMLIETFLLLWVGATGYHFDGSVVRTEFFAGMLLFAMGMQNALVTIVSGSAVRSTHLTGIVTDLGIDLSAACVRNGKKIGTALVRRIVLRFTIIGFFLLGGVLGVFCFQRFRYHCFYVPACLVFIAMSFDFFRVWLTRIYLRKRSGREKPSL